MVDRVYTRIDVLVRKGGKKSRRGDRCEWVRVTFHKHEKTALQRKKKKEEKIKKKRGKDPCVSNRKYAYATSRLITDRVSSTFYRLTGITNPWLYLYQKSAVLRAILRTKFDTSKWYATCASTKPFKPSGCNAPITVCTRVHARKKREIPSGSPVNFNWLHRGVLGPIHRISDMQMQFNDAISCT